MVSVDTKKQAGFGAVAILAAVLVVAVLGFVGWRLYSSYSKPSVDTTTSSNQAAHQTGNTQTNTTNASASDQATYLDIKELGIKVKLSDSIKDAVYSYNAPDSTALSTSSAFISTTSLAAAASSCAATAGGALGTIIKTSDPNVTGTTLVPNGTTVFKLGSNYYYLTEPGAPCTTDTTASSLATQQKTTFRDDFKTVQLDN
jgi:Tfp pilus assembly protein PilV